MAGDSAAHTPLVAGLDFPANPIGAIIDCSCGWKGVPFSAMGGAQWQWLSHVVASAAELLPDNSANEPGAHWEVFRA